jgi:hypothetical protein
LFHTHFISFWGKFEGSQTTLENVMTAVNRELAKPFSRVELEQFLQVLSDNQDIFFDSGLVERV